MAWMVRAQRTIALSGNQTLPLTWDWPPQWGGTIPKAPACPDCDEPLSYSDVHSSVLEAVAEFHIAFGLPMTRMPCTDGIAPELRDLRIRLLEEEVLEFVESAQINDLPAMADALGDVVYVAYGTALTYGIDLDAVVAEIHRANMSKLNSLGEPVLRCDGKVLKSELYRAPDIAAVLAEQLPLPFPDETVTRRP
jgi:predicted HAD superfamily Cof-like phosphohydrolase